VLFRSFQLVLETRRQFETGLIVIVTGVEVVIGNCLLVYLAPLSKYDVSKIIGSRPWPFGVTWRHRLRDHSTRGGWLPMDGH